MTKVIAFTPASNITIDILWTRDARRATPARHDARRVMIINSITPETERSCHYFWGHARDFDTANTDMTAFFHRVV